MGLEGEEAREERQDWISHLVDKLINPKPQIKKKNDWMKEREGQRETEGQRKGTEMRV